MTLNLVDGAIQLYSQIYLHYFDHFDAALMTALMRMHAAFLLKLAVQSVPALEMGVVDLASASLPMTLVLMGGLLVNQLISLLADAESMMHKIKIIDIFTFLSCHSISNHCNT